MLMQLPAPEDCMSSAPRCAAEPCAGEHRDAFLLGGERDRLHVGVGVAVEDELRVARVGHVRDLLDVEPLERLEDVGRPEARRGFWFHSDECSVLRVEW